MPVWRYALGDALVEQRVFMAPGGNTSYLRLSALRATAPLKIEFKPLVTYRDYHSEGRGMRPFSAVADADGTNFGIGVDARDEKRFFDRTRPSQIPIVRTA